MKAMDLENSERSLLLALLADFQIQTLRKLKNRELETAHVRALRRDLALAGTASLTVGYVPPKA